MEQQNGLLSVHFFSSSREFLIMLVIPTVIPVGSTVGERSFSCVKQIETWLRNSMLTDLLGDLAIIAIHRHTILILKTDICSAFMVSLLFIEITIVISDFL